MRTVPRQAGRNRRLLSYRVTVWEEPVPNKHPEENLITRTDAESTDSAKNSADAKSANSSAAAESRDMDYVYRKHAQDVYKFLMSMTGGDADLSEELTQETFYQAVRNVSRFDGSCKITTWLCAIAKNQLAAYRRKHPQTETYSTTDSVPAGAGNADASGGTAAAGLQTARSAEDEVMAGENKLDLMKHLHSVSEPYREVLYLRYFGELSFREIGEIMGKSENWARVTCYRGKERLRAAVLGADT